MQEYIKIFNITIYVYGIFTLLGIIISFIFIMGVNEKEKINKEDLIITFLISILFFFFGTKIINMIETKSVNFCISNGFTYTGGVLVGIISIYLTSKVLKYEFDLLLSIFIVMFPTIYCFSKIGCFFNGCCSGILVMPIQLIESILGMILIVLILTLKRRNKNNKQIINLYYITYGLARVLLDFCRENRNNIIFTLTLTQIICILLFCVGIISLYKQKRRILYERKVE